MEKSNDIQKNFMFQIIYEVLILILPLVTSPYIARVVGTKGVGIYSYSSSIAYYFVLFAMLGIANYGNREIARCRNSESQLNKTASNLIALHIIISLISLAIYIIYIMFFCSDKIYAIMQIPYVLSAVFDISWLYFGMEKFDITVLVNIISKISTVVLIFLFIKEKDDLWKYCLFLACGTMFSQLALWVPLKRYVIVEKISYNEMKKHLKPLLILSVPALAISLYTYMDKIMLGNMTNKSQLGLYENAEKMVNIPSTIIIAFGTVMLPKMSNLAGKNKCEQSLKYISISVKYIMALACALAFGLGGVARVFSVVFWGTEFSACGYLIMGLALKIPFFAFANVIRTQFLIPNKKDKEYLVSIVVGAVANLIINISLIPVMAARGAVIGTIIAEAMVCIIQILCVKSELPIKKFIKEVLHFFIYGCCMFFAVYMCGLKMGNSIRTLVLQVGVGGIFYGLMCIIRFAYEKDTLFLQILASIKKVKEG